MNNSIEIFSINDLIQAILFLITIIGTILHFNTRMVKLEGIEKELMERVIPNISRRLEKNEENMIESNKDLSKALSDLNLTVAELKQVLDLLLRERK